MKIAELLEEYGKLSKQAGVKKMTKKAFVPNPNMPPPGQPQAQPPQDPQAAAQQGQPQQAPGQPVQQQLPPPPQPQQAPPQALPQQGGQQMPQEETQLLNEVLQAAQQLPPEAQQQVMPILQQLMSLPPEQAEAKLQQILQQLGAGAQQGGQPQQQPPQPQGGGMVAQASVEDMYGGAMPPSEGSPEAAAQDAGQAEASAIEARNELDNVRVSLTVRELLDLVGKGSATASLLKVKQLADTHEQKMEQSRQKAETQQADAQQQQQQSQQGMMSGGIYPSPMDGQAQQ